MLRKDADFRVPGAEVAPGAPFYTNPLVDNMPDPMVTYDAVSGYYYSLGARFDEQGKGVWVYRSKSLSDLRREGRAAFYLREEYGLYDCAWASELHRIGDRWYIYAAAACHPTRGYAERAMRTFVMASRTDDPLDGFDFAGILGDDAIIDATVLRLRDGRLYLCASRLFEEDRQKLILQPMASPTCLAGEAVCLARATYPWERMPPYDGDQCINEGPFFIENAGRTFCVYSFNGCWCDDYGLGILELVGDDPMDPRAWVKDDVPWLVKGNGMYAPGHASFFRSPDGKELYVAYHVVLAHNPDDRPMPRHCCVQRVYFDKTGFPHVGEPVPRGQALPLPGGDEERPA